MDWLKILIQTHGLAEDSDSNTWIAKRFWFYHMDWLNRFAFPLCCVAYFLVYEAWQMISPEKVNFFLEIPFLTSYWWSWEHCPNVNHWFLAAGHSFITLSTSQQASVFHKHTYYYFSLHILNDCSALHKWQNTRIFDFHFLELYFWTVTYQMAKNTKSL